MLGNAVSRSTSTAGSTGSTPAASTSSPIRSAPRSRRENSLVGRPFDRFLPHLCRLFPVEGGNADVFSVKVGAGSMIVAGVGSHDLEFLVALDEGEVGFLLLFGIAALVGEPAEGWVPGSLATDIAEVIGGAANHIDREEELPT